MRTRRLLIGGAIFVLGLAAVAGLALMRMMSAPMFSPGTVRDRVAASGGSLDPMSVDPAPDTWQVTPDVALHHDTFGEGDDVLYVHGGPGFPTQGRPRGLEALGKTHRVHLYDQRGCGKSTRPFARAPEGSFYEKLVAVEGKLGLAEQIADIERIRRRLGRERLALVGHSFGGLVAALYAAEFPERVSALVLVSPAPLVVMPKEGDDLFAVVRARLGESERPRYDAYMKGYFDFQAEMALDEPALSRRFGEFRSYYAHATGGVEGPNDGDAGGFLILATYASLGKRHDWRDALKQIRAKTVVIHGAGDLVPEADTRALAEGIPGATVEVVAGATHFAIDETPDAFVAAFARAK